MFKIVQTVEKDVKELSIVPSAWENNNVLFWPKKRADKLIKLPNSAPEEGWFKLQCKLKRSNLSYEEAEEELENMLERHETEQEEERPKRPRAPKKTVDQDFNFVAEDCLMLQENELPKRPRVLLPKKQSSDQDNDFCLLLQENNVLLPEPLEDNCSYVYENVDTNTQQNQMIKIIENQNIIINNLQQFMQSTMQQMAKLETMLDILAAKEGKNCACEKNSSNPIEQSDTIIEPINDLEDLIKLEQLLSDSKVADDFVTKFSYICGRKGGGSGIDNCYKLVDRIFSRTFMTLCSWAGGAKDGKEKIPFKIYKNTIQMFFRVIHLSDKDFTLQKCEEFLKNVIRNSKRRSESNMLRSSKSKRRPSQLIYRIKESNQQPMVDQNNSND